MDGSTKKLEAFILVIDAGTQSIRGALINLRGEIVEILKTPIDPYYSKQPGWAEQDPEYYWKMLCATCRGLLDSRENLRNAVKGVAVTTQRATMINVDKNGKPLRPAIIWLDQRKAAADQWWLKAMKPPLKVLRLYDTIETAIKDCEANWIRSHQPEVWDKTYKYLLLSGYLTYKLTGEFKESVGNNIGYLPINNKTFHWSNRFDYKWKLFPVERSKLPELVKSAELLGYITREAEQETGIPEGLPVIAAGTDKGCEILGAGCLTPEIACLSYGTTATINTATKKYVEVIPFIPPYPSAVPDEYYTEVMVYRGFWMVSWFKEEFGFQERLLALERKIEPEFLFDELIKDVEPGSMGLMLQPYWSPGLNTDSYAKGSIIGFGDIHSRAHLYRAILEGLAYALKEGAIRTEKRNRVPIVKLRVSGGGSQSDAAMQITADIFGKPAERPYTNETSSVGAAIVASVGLGLHPDFETAVKEMTRVERVFEPIPENQRLYDDLFENVYLKIYKKLRPLFEQIQAITGYPQ
ncbi:MAG: FGGY-family carbohydrate kinase [Deltaproteobacteria bacterium]|nr:FGGY-family carbohydrate kinase [Deltaproteobacteria bacterium]MBW2053701.1 FGGY-family carbohydrate kinase [Deltaproteobacteria bacterium]MBW2141520.1 FGGY-family carbohydrate kinase [Deltaproteobacteria bacterium]